MVDSRALPEDDSLSEQTSSNVEQNSPHPASSIVERPVISSETEVNDASCDPATAEAELAEWNLFGEYIKLALKTSRVLPSDVLPERIGSFSIVRVLGSGGNGTVYLGQDCRLTRTVAIKVPHCDRVRHSSTRDRFLQEAKLVASLQHPSIVEVYQIGETAGLPYLVFEYCAGGSLAEWLSQQVAPPSFRVCATLLFQLAAAVHYAHVRGVLHRDLNPKNVLLVPLSDAARTEDGQEFPFHAKLSDFGLGTWLNSDLAEVKTQTGAMVGTIPYMAPEQTSGSSRFLLPAVDIHALGVMLFELLTLQRPYNAESSVEMLRMISDLPAPPPSRIRRRIPRDLETICLKCLEKSPDQRYQSAQLLADDLERYLQRRPILASRSSISMRVWQWMGRHPLVAGLLAVIGSLGSVLGIVAFWYSAQLAISLEKTVRFQTQSRADQELVRGMAYAGQMRRAQELLDYGHDFAAGKLLRGWIPTGSESDLRKFDWYYLKQACGGEVICLPRGSSPTKTIYSAAISPDGNRAAIGIESAIEIWDLSTRSLEKILPVGTQFGIVRDLMWVNEDRLLLAASAGTEVISLKVSGRSTPNVVVKSDSVSEFCVRMIPTSGERHYISLASSSLAFSPPCKIRLQEAGTDRKLWQDVHTHPRFDIQFDAINRRIFATDDNGLVSFDLAGQKKQAVTVQKTLYPILSLALSSDGRWLAAAHLDRCLSLFKNESGRLSFQGQFPVVPNAPSNWRFGDPHCYLRNPLAFNRSGTQLVSGCSTELHLWDVAQRQELQSILKLPGEIRVVRALADNRTYFWGTDQDAGLWTPVSRQPQIAGHERETWAVAFSPDGQILATGSDDETIKLWDLRSERLIRSLTGHSATVAAIAFSPDGHRLASASLDQTVRIWDVKSGGTPRILQGHPGTVRSLGWSRDGKRLISGETIYKSLPTVIEWDANTGQLLRRWNDHKAYVRAVLFCEDGKRCITASEDCTVHLRDLQTGAVETLVTDTAPLHAAVLLHDDRWLATANRQGLIRIWDLNSRKILRELQGHAVMVRSLAISPDGKVMASGSEDNTVRLWDTFTGECLLVLRGHKAAVNSVAFSPDGQLLSSGAHDGSVRLWHAPK